MNLVFITDARYVRTEDGNVYSLESSFSYSLYKRYMQNFDKVTIIARVKQGTLVDVLLENCVTLGGVDVVDLPYYVGFDSYLKCRKMLKKRINSFFSTADLSSSVIICRVPGRVGATAISEMQRQNIKYGIEVVGDPYDVLSKGVTNHPLRPILRILSYLSLQKVAKLAPAALYVTKYKLQERYPCPNFSVGVSDVFLNRDAFVDESKIISNSILNLISVGTLEQLYKAPDVVIEALKLLSDWGIKYNFTWIGDGMHKNRIIDLCDKLGISKNVTFVGKLSSGNAVREYLDKADIFLMPSRMEGLPRALVEAMARALPCVATRICGINELLDEDVLISVNNPLELAQKIKILAQNPQFAANQSKKNLAKAREYEDCILTVKRNEFYDYLKTM